MLSIWYKKSPIIFISDNKRKKILKIISNNLKASCLYI